MKISAFNSLSEKETKAELTRCCGSSLWVSEMMKACPIDSLDDAFKKSKYVNGMLKKEDWLEAFSHHPRIGDIDNLRKRFASTASWSANEQGSLSYADEKTLHELKQLNDEYFEKFGFIFIICASGKSASEMLDALKARLPNDADTEIKNAAKEQSKITELRLEKLFL